jgi:hypothetical protein
MSLSEASVAINELAKIVAGEADLLYIPYEEPTVKETAARLIRALTGRRIFGAESAGTGQGNCYI